MIFVFVFPMQKLCVRKKFSEFLHVGFICISRFTEITFTFGVFSLGVENVGFECFCAFYFTVFGEFETFFCSGMGFKLCVHFDFLLIFGLQKAIFKRTYLPDLELMIITMLLPSSLGILSTEPNSATPSANFCTISVPSSG